jgi:hypothetical protein
VDDTEDRRSEAWVPIAAYHDVLLRIADWTSDELTTAARHQLADGRVEAVASLIAWAAVSGRLPMPRSDVDLVAGTLDRAGRTEPTLAASRTADRLGLPFVSWASGPPESVDSFDAAAVHSIDRESHGTAPA